MLDALLILGVVPDVGVRKDGSNVDLRADATRDDRGVNSEERDLRNTVCGTTPNFCSSTSPAVRRFFSASGSRLKRDAKLGMGEMRKRYLFDITDLDIAFANLRM